MLEVINKIQTACSERKLSYSVVQAGSKSMPGPELWPLHYIILPSLTFGHSNVNEETSSFHSSILVHFTWTSLECFMDFQIFILWSLTFCHSIFCEETSSFHSNSLYWDIYMLKEPMKLHHSVVFSDMHWFYISTLHSKNR